MANFHFFSVHFMVVVRALEIQWPSHPVSFSTFIRGLFSTHYIDSGSCYLASHEPEISSGQIKGAKEVWHQGKIWLRPYTIGFVIQWDNVILNIISNPCDLAPVASFGLQNLFGTNLLNTDTSFHLSLLWTFIDHRQSAACHRTTRYWRSLPRGLNHVNGEGKRIQI